MQERWGETQNTAFDCLMRHHLEPVRETQQTQFLLGCRTVEKTKVFVSFSKTEHPVLKLVPNLDDEL